VTGEHLLTAPFVETNWASGLDADGHPKPVLERQPQLQGALTMTGGTNWNAPSFDPDTQLLYVQGHQGFEVSYLTPETDKGTEDHQGGATSNLWFQQLLVALDYQTGRERWHYGMPSAANGGLGAGTAIGVLTTAGHVLITGDNAGNAVALDPKTGHTLWHAQLSDNVSGSPMTYEVDGKQYILTAADSVVVYAFALLGS
jgi:alcohol dehydrogenase (cytochrome c)